MFIQYAEQREASIDLTREFLTVFSYNGYQYFIVSIDSEVVITRLCLSDNGDQESPLDTFASHFELELECASSESATAATFVNSTEQFGVETVLLAFQVAISDTFHICAFNLSEINERMNLKFETCINGSGISEFRDREVSCPSLSPEQIDSMVSPSFIFGQDVITRLNFVYVLYTKKKCFVRLGTKTAIATHTVTL